MLASPHVGVSPAVKAMLLPSTHWNVPSVQLQKMVTVAIPQGNVGLHTAPSVLQAAPTVASIVAGQAVAASGEVDDAELELHAVEAPVATTPTTRPKNTPTNERDTSKVIPSPRPAPPHIPSPVKRSNANFRRMRQRTRTAVPGSIPWDAG
jgi:hypothetical protein